MSAMASPLISPETYITTTFATLLQPFAPAPSSMEKWSQLLLTSYSEPQRHYHTTMHIYSMLQHLSANLSLIKNPTAVGLAIIFHDWEYLPHTPARYNEEQSIVHFSVFAEELALPPTLITTVKNYILATIKHKVAPGDEDDSDLKLFLDFDLEVLGRERAEYDVYRKQIRREYAQFDDQQFSGGRSQVLQKMLDRERVYFSDAFFERFEERARENLKWELEILRAACQRG